MLMSSVIERWSDVDALKVHLTALHMKSYQKAVKDSLDHEGSVTATGGRVI